MRNFLKHRSPESSKVRQLPKAKCYRGNEKSAQVRMEISILIHNIQAFLYSVNVENVPRVVEKSIERTRSATNDEATWKMEKSIENRVFRNKCLLKTVKNVIRTVRKQESLFGANWKSDCMKPQNKIAETNLVKHSPKKVSKIRVTKESGTLKPMFKRAEVETLLNESMHEAVKKYRMCSSTWENIIKANSLKTC